MKNKGLEAISEKLFDYPQRKYFFDYLTVNIHIPRKKHNIEQLLMTKEILSQFYSYMHSRVGYEKGKIQWGWLDKKRNECDNFYGVHFPISNFNKMYHFITVQISGRFWAGDVFHKYIPVDPNKKMDDKNRHLVAYSKHPNIIKNQIPTTNLVDDIRIAYNAIIDIQEIVNTIMCNYKPFLRKKCRTTISRIDIATQKKCSLNKGCGRTNRPTFHMKRHKNNIIMPFVNVFTNKYSAFTLGKRNTKKEGIDRNKFLLRVYDKDQSVDELNKLICLKRFGSTNYIRKEWEMKSSFYGPNSSHKISTIEDLRSCILNKKRLRQLIRSMRRTSDCILKSDGQHYRALHDTRVQKLLKKAHKLTESDLNRIYTKINIPNAHYVNDINRVSEKDIQKNKKPWNPFAMIKGMLSNHGKNITKEQFAELQQIISSF
jgi:hypothetical protein